jgi:hypothetical protein
MLIYGAFFWPTLFGIALFFLARKKVIWWEYFLPFAICALLICGGKLAVEKSMTSDTEYWGDKAQSSIYNEAWEEEVPCTHTKYCSGTRTNSKGETENYDYACGTEHSYDVDSHPPEWHLIDSSGNDHGISSGYFEYLCKLWNNRQFVELNHTSVHMGRDGDRYVTTWDNKRETLIPIITKHTYENRVIASKNIYRFKEVTPKEAKEKALFEYPDPDGQYQMDAILGNAGNQKAVGEKEFNYLNATYGPSHQVRFWILLFENKPIDVAYSQQAYWQGGNKNEFVICIGLNKQHEIQWVLPFCWKPDAPEDKDKMNMLSIQTRDFLLEQKGKQLNLKNLAGWLEREIPKNWRRKKFAEFSYLTVEPPTSAVITINILVILICIGLAYWILTNEFDEEGRSYKNSRGYRRYR